MITRSGAFRKSKVLLNTGRGNKKKNIKNITTFLVIRKKGRKLYQTFLKFLMKSGLVMYIPVSRTMKI